MHRAHSLSVGQVVAFRLCQSVAWLQGLESADTHGSVKMMPMAYAETVRRRQKESFAYMR